jgi:hypothetical protein
MNLGNNQTMASVGSLVILPDGVVEVESRNYKSQISWPVSANSWLFQPDNDHHHACHQKTESWMIFDLLVDRYVLVTYRTG